MHRRQRHFKGSSVGCNLQLDARYLTDSDGTAVSSWSDRSSNSYSASQSTAANRPTVKTGANGVNGNTAVSFDATNDFLTISSFVISSDMYFLIAGNLSSQNMIVEQTTNANSGNAFYVYGQANRAFNIVRTPGGNAYDIGLNNWIGTGNSIGTVWFAYQYGMGYYSNGVQQPTGGNFNSFSSATNATDTLYIMSRGGGSLFSGGLVGSLILGSGYLTEPMRKRLQNNLALSFKIACS